MSVAGIVAFNFDLCVPPPGDKIFVVSKIKALADSESNITQNIRFVFHRVENIVGKRENTADKHFLLFSQLTHYQTTNFRLPNWKSLQTTISGLTKMEESYPNRKKTLQEKEKLLVMSNFSFSHSVFKRLVSQGCQKVSLCANGLRGVFLRSIKRCHLSRDSVSFICYLDITILHYHILFTQ